MRWWTNTPSVWLTWPWSLWAVGTGVHIVRVLVLTGTCPIPSVVWSDAAPVCVPSSPLWVAWRVPGAQQVPGRARGPPSERWDTLGGMGPSSSGSHTRARGKLILSLLLRASSEHSCFSGLENPGFPSPYLDNSWTADRYWTLESNWSS